MIKENEGKITGDYIITDEVLGSGAYGVVK